MPTSLFNLLLALLLIGTPVNGGSMAEELAERDETAQQRPSEKRAFRLETPVRPHDLGWHEVRPHTTTFHAEPALRVTASQKFLPPRQFNERRLI
ncbi:MAG: hypothetical protein KF773_06935 [Deltaproteobacteria bacterium]|nr:hypothetical protein [Deltaproteobacteria bacterium]MCW5807549.1 hypothetical protein [Deltaproteobacteria bacterium]